MSKSESSNVQSGIGLKKVELAGVFNAISAFSSRSDVTIDEIEELTRRLYGVIRTEHLIQTEGVTDVLFDNQPQSTVTGSVVNEQAVATTVALPAIPLDRAVTDDQVFCLCCGKGFTMLKRHLGSVHELTEAEYRRMFDLSSDFPLVAPKYSKRKAEHARSSGLGKYARETLESAEDTAR